MRHEATLFHRVLSGCAEPAAWDELEEKARRDPELWHRLALSLKDQNELNLGVASTVLPVDAMDLADLRETATHKRRSESARVARFRLGPWVGWAAAACLSLLWLAGVPGSPSNPTPTAKAATMQQALDLYRQAGTREGRLVEELPLLVVDRKPAPKGKGTEVVYLRRILERRRVQNLYEAAPDEWGNPVAIPAQYEPQRREEL